MGQNPRHQSHTKALRSRADLEHPISDSLPPSQRIPTPSSTRDTTTGGRRGRFDDHGSPGYRLTSTTRIPAPDTSPKCQCLPTYYASYNIHKPTSWRASLQRDFDSRETSNRAPTGTFAQTSSTCSQDHRRSSSTTVTSAYSRSSSNPELTTVTHSCSMRSCRKSKPDV